jgi:hypothetical protein
MSSEFCFAGSDGVDDRLRKDSLAQRGDELGEQAPAAGWRQAAIAQRGESSSSSINGSSSKMVRR